MSSSVRRVETDVVVIGGGAAGLFCASIAAKRGRRVVVLERSEKPGKKILISGGGRCNFTNRVVTPDNFISKNPHFARSVFSRFDNSAFIKLVESHGISYHEKTLGQLFCNNSSREILDMILSECRAGGVSIECDSEIISIEKNEHWIVTTSTSEVLADSVVVACGGLPIPKMGATDFGLRVAKQFGLTIVPTAPALVPLTLGDDFKDFKDLSGISIDCETSANGVVFQEAILFSHRGVTGPAVLQISSYLQPTESFTINLFPQESTVDFVESNSSNNAEFKTILSHRFSKRFAEAMTVVLEEELKFPLARPFKQVDKKSRAVIAETLANWFIQPSGTEGYAKAEVMRGGVDTGELNQKTMESKRVAGLYFIGEVVDVTGWLGGYNFQWAWSSGYSAGMSA